MSSSREREALERAIALGEDSPAQLRRLGSLYAREGSWHASGAVYRRAIEAAPDELPAYQGLSQALFAQQDLEGLQCLAAELEQRFPQASFTHVVAGHLSKALGDSVAARTSYARALDLEPTLGEALFGIVDLGLPVDDSLKEHAAALVSRSDLSVPDSVNSCFAWARILDQAGRYADAFEYFQRANTAAREELARLGMVYEPRRVERRVDEIITAYPSESFETLLDPLPIELVPVFVVGLPRSGTTLIEQILASHPDVEAGGELVFARECERWFHDRRQAAGRKGPVNPMNEEDAGMLEEARERYTDAIFERDLEGPWIVDKMPANFEIAGFIRMLFPNAPIVHSVRDPRATCFSLYTANFDAHEPYYHALDHLAHYHGQYRRVMEYWRTVLPGPCIEIDYEDLVRDPETHIPALLENIGLAPDPACLAFYDHSRPVLTASHAQVRQPMYTSAIDRWRNYEQWLGPLRDLYSSV